MSTALYFVGFLVLIAGLAWGASILGVPPLWIGIGVVVLTGIAIISIASNVKDTEIHKPQNPPPQNPPPQNPPPQNPPPQNPPPRDPPA